jgi:hypothetical protein
MRSDRFDRLVRGLAARHTRRQFLAGVAGVALTGAVREFSPPFTPATDAETICRDGESAPICLGSIDHVANATSLMRSLAIGTNSGCLAGDSPCERDETCCSGVCTMHGRCGCFETSHLCPGDGFCCGGSCVNGRCV